VPALQFLERLFRLLLPPASREHVLGDLHEKCKSPRQYLSDAISVLGPVIIGRIRRTTDFQVCLIEIFVVYLSFSAAAWWIGQSAFLYDHSGFARLVIPTTVIVIGLLLCNAYADPEKHPSLIRPVLQTAGSIALAFFGQAVIFDTSPNFVVPLAVMLYGSCTSFVLVSTLRMIFPPIFSSWARTALLNEHRVLPKPYLIPARVPLQRIRQMVSEVPRPVGSKTVLTCTVALSIAALLLLPVQRAVFVIAVLVVLSVLYQIRPRE
jgi:hypothetical protein